MCGRAADQIANNIFLRREYNIFTIEDFFLKHEKCILLSICGRSGGGHSVCNKLTEITLPQRFWSAGCQWSV